METNVGNPDPAVDPNAPDGSDTPDTPDAPDQDSDDETGDETTGAPPWPRAWWYSVREFSAGVQLEAVSSIGDPATQEQDDTESAILTGGLVVDVPHLKYQRPWPNTSDVSGWVCNFVPAGDGQGHGMDSFHMIVVSGTPGHDAGKDYSTHTETHMDADGGASLDNDWARLTIDPAHANYSPMFSAAGMTIPGHSVTKSTAPDIGGNPVTTTSTEDDPTFLSKCSYLPLVPTPLPDAIGDLADHGEWDSDQSAQGGWKVSQKAQWTLTPRKWYQYPDIEVVFRTFIPAPWVVMDCGLGYVAALGGDGRGFDYSAPDVNARSYCRFTVNLDPRLESPLIGDVKYDFGFSHTLKSGLILRSPGDPWPAPDAWVHSGVPPEFVMLSHVDGKPWWWWDWAPDYTGSKGDDVVITTHRDKGDATFDIKPVSHKPNTARVSINYSASVPAADPVLRLTAPSADAQLLLELRADPDDPFVDFRWTGMHDGFPAYELYINRQPAYLYSPENHGCSPISMMPSPVGTQVQVNPARGWLPQGQALSTA